MWHAEIDALRRTRVLPNSSLVSFALPPLFSNFLPCIARCYATRGVRDVKVNHLEQFLGRNHAWHDAQRLQTLSEPKTTWNSRFSVLVTDVFTVLTDKGFQWEKQETNVFGSSGKSTRRNHCLPLCNSARFHSVSSKTFRNCSKSYCQCYSANCFHYSYSFAYNRVKLHSLFLKLTHFQMFRVISFKIAARSPCRWSRSPSTTDWARRWARV